MSDMTEKIVTPDETRGAQVHVPKQPEPPKPKDK